MPRQMGANVRLYQQTETVYGTPPSGNWRAMPFLSANLGAEQPFIDNDVIGIGNNRDAGAPFRDTLNVSGRVEVPIDYANFGHWLLLLLGPPTTTGTSPNFVHTFASGAAALPSKSIEIAYPDVPNFDVCAGVRADTLDIDFSPSGPATATIGLLGQGSTRSATSSAGTPVAHAYTAFQRPQGTITRNGLPLAQVTSARMTFQNGMDVVRTIRPDLRAEGVDPGIARATGQMTVRFENTTLLNQAANGTSAEFEMGFVASADRRLLFTLHEVYLSVARTPVEGPGGVEATFDFRAAYNAAAGRMMTVVLRNGEASYA